MEINTCKFLNDKDCLDQKGCLWIDQRCRKKTTSCRIHSESILGLKKG